MSAEFTYRFHVPFHQVDHAGIMFYAHLFVHAHDAYAKLMESCSWDLPGVIGEHKYSIPLIHAEADYHHPLRHGDLVIADLQLQRLGDSSFGLGYRFSCSGKLCATARTDHTFISNQTASAVSIPGSLRSELEKYR